MAWSRVCRGSLWPRSLRLRAYGHIFLLRSHAEQREGQQGISGVPKVLPSTPSVCMAPSTPSPATLNCVVLPSQCQSLEIRKWLVPMPSAFHHPELPVHLGTIHGTISSPPISLQTFLNFLLFSCLLIFIGCRTLWDFTFFIAFFSLKNLDLIRVGQLSY